MSPCLCRHEANPHLNTGIGRSIFATPAQRFILGRIGYLGAFPGSVGGLESHLSRGIAPLTGLLKVYVAAVLETSHQLVTKCQTPTLVLFELLPSHHVLVLLRLLQGELGTPIIARPTGCWKRQLSALRPLTQEARDLLDAKDFNIPPLRGEPQ